MSFEDFKINTHVKASLVSVVCPGFEGHETIQETKASLLELRELARTLGLTSGLEYIQNKQSIEPKAILGTGKLEEIAKAAKEEGSEILIFDFELKASQQRNIKAITKMEVIDRCTVILEIFSKHAHTNEAKLQIEIARLQYMLPRLTSYWTHFSKQKGGIGQKGEGEQQLELDRRIIRTRIERYKEQLEGLAISRTEQRKKRQQKTITAALVGYTNAGKSSLMNKLCKVNVLAEDKLFATLDSTFRTLNPDTKPPMILIDTVGFLSNLPNTLISGFKTTLDSALEADLLILVVDISHPDYQKHIKVTEEVLEELEILDKEKIIVFTKKDLVQTPFEEKIKARNYKDSFVISVHNDEDIVSLRKYIIDYFLSLQPHFDLFIPFEKGHIHALLRAKTNIVQEENFEQGIFYRVKAPLFILDSLNLDEYKLAPTDKKVMK